MAFNRSCDGVGKELKVGFWAVWPEDAAPLANFKPCLQMERQLTHLT